MSIRPALLTGFSTQRGLPPTHCGILLLNGAVSMPLDFLTGWWLNWVGFPIRTAILLGSHFEHSKKWQQADHGWYQLLLGDDLFCISAWMVGYPLTANNGGPVDFPSNIIFWGVLISEISIFPWWEVATNILQAGTIHDPRSPPARMLGGTMLPSWETAPFLGMVLRLQGTYMLDQAWWTWQTYTCAARKPGNVARYRNPIWMHNIMLACFFASKPGPIKVLRNIEAYIELPTS